MAKQQFIRCLCKLPPQRWGLVYFESVYLLTKEQKKNLRQPDYTTLKVTVFTAESVLYAIVSIIMSALWIAFCARQSFVLGVSAVVAVFFINFFIQFMWPLFGRYNILSDTWVWDSIPPGVTQVGLEKKVNKKIRNWRVKYLNQFDVDQLKTLWDYSNEDRRDLFTIHGDTI